MTFEQRLDILHRLRRARAMILADSEAFVEAAAVIEYVGQVNGGRSGHGLGTYRDNILELAKETGRFDKEKDQRDLRCLFDIVLSARNSAAHTGSWARHHSVRLVELILILEEAILHGDAAMNTNKSSTKQESPLKLTKVKHLMVAGPIIAFEWNTLAHIRTSMLEHSFSYIPVKRETGSNPPWIMISDAWLMARLRKTDSRTSWNKELGKTVKSALEELTDQERHVMKAQFCDDVVLVSDIVDKLKAAPLLVRPSTHPEEVIGIITASDLL